MFFFISLVILSTETFKSYCRLCYYNYSNYIKVINSFLFSVCYPLSPNEHNNIWAASWQNQHNGFADQHGSRPACASAQSDQDPWCSLSVSLLVIELVSEQHRSWSDCADRLIILILNRFITGILILNRLIILILGRLLRIYGFWTGWLSTYCECTDFGPIYCEYTDFGPIDYTDFGPVDYTDLGPVDYTDFGPVDYTDFGPIYCEYTDFGPIYCEYTDFGPIDYPDFGPMDYAID
jgi:hypothetical protein